MTDALSSNTKAILLLTAPLITGRSTKPSDLLTPGEYKKLAKHLLEVGAKPADLLTPAADQLLGECHRVIDKARLERLLARGFLLSQAVERWHARAIWVVSRADGTYPQRLKARLREDAPAILYGCGDRKVLESGGLAVVGSRNVEDALIEYTQTIGRLAASAGRTLVSGGARGIDQAAMRGALEAGGRVTGVLADSLEKTAMQREHRNMLLEDQLVLVSPYDPSAGFNVGHAMQRNKLIYALADAALVVSAERGKGGTWAGAIEQIEKLHLVPVFVRATAGSSAGLDALVEKGALVWSEPVDADSLAAAIATPAPEHRRPVDQGRLSFPTPRNGAGEVREAVTSASSYRASSPPADQPELSATDELFSTVRSLVIRLVRRPTKAA
jgi:predicted Rossmann fold nucleotide-binding protein DprA/Smf involved in DNA uptake